MNIVGWLDYLLLCCSQTTKNKLYILELKFIFYYSIYVDATKGHIEKIGNDAHRTIEKKIFYFQPHAKSSFEFCFKSKLLHIEIWMTSLKQTTTRILRKLVLGISQGQYLFICTTLYFTS